MADNISHTVPTSGMGQETFQQCWFAAFKMIYTFKGLNTNSIKDKLSKVIDFNDAMANGLFDTDYKKCAEALGLTYWKGTDFNQERGFFDVGITDGAEALHKHLRQGPLWVSRKISKDSYHITVLKGYEDTSKGDFVINNPYPGPKDALEQRVSASHYARMVTGANASVQR